MKKFLSFILVAATALMAFAACGSKSADKSGSAIRIGSKGFTENEIVAEVYALTLEDAGLKVERTPDLGSTIIHQSLTTGDIDLYPEYTGTGLISVLKEEPRTSANEVYQEVKKAYEDKFKISWLDYSPANDGQGIVITKAASDQYGIKTISDLQKNAERIRFASQGEFDQRADGIPALTAKYGEFHWKSTNVYDNALKYQVLDQNQADAAPAYTTEGQLSDTSKYVLLEDDKQAWPPYNLAPVVRDEVLEKNPKIAEALNKISPKITTENITKANAEVDLKGKEYKDVAKELYESIK